MKNFVSSKLHWAGSLHDAKTKVASSAQPVGRHVFYCHSPRNESEAPVSSFTFGVERLLRNVAISFAKLADSKTEKSDVEKKEKSKDHERDEKERSFKEYWFLNWRQWREVRIISVWVPFDESTKLMTCAFCRKFPRTEKDCGCRQWWLREPDRLRLGIL